MPNSPIVCVVAEEISNVSNLEIQQRINAQDDQIGQLRNYITLLKEEFYANYESQMEKFAGDLATQKAEFDDKFRIGALDILVCIIFIIIIVLVIVHIFVEH